MAVSNRYGLSRHIPARIKREVRQRSKFGCVVCRGGFYQYEHIDPSFEDAREHDPERICCLCGSCHDSVTRGRLSKELVKSSYEGIQTLDRDDCPPPVGPLDFHNGSAELLIGGLIYSPLVRTVIRYHGYDIIRVLPSTVAGEPGQISAILTNDEGEELLRLEENEWIGSISSWDIESVGQHLTVRREDGTVSLQLRLDPPGRIVVEHLDMRVNDAHILATEKTYAVARYIQNSDPHWVHAHAMIRKSSPHGIAIEFTEPNLLEVRDTQFFGKAQELATDDRRVVLNASGGILIKPLGIAIATLCSAFDLATLAVGGRELSAMRKVVFDYPDQVDRFIGTGELSA